VIVPTRNEAGNIKPFCLTQHQKTQLTKLPCRGGLLSMTQTDGHSSGGRSCGFAVSPDLNVRLIPPTLQGQRTGGPGEEQWWWGFKTLFQAEYAVVMDGGPCSTHQKMLPVFAETRLWKKQADMGRGPLAVPKDSPGGQVLKRGRANLISKALDLTARVLFPTPNCTAWSDPADRIFSW
jgi:hypothetical protein